MKYILAYWVDDPYYDYKKEIELFDDKDDILPRVNELYKEYKNTLQIICAGSLHEIEFETIEYVKEVRLK